jgi:CheY-like chemotaxis protein
LSISKLDSGRYKVQTVNFELGSVVAGIDALYRGEAEKKHLALGFVGLDAVPATLSSDPDRIRQVLGNLVSNAIKYTDSGSIEVQFSWQASDRDDAPKSTERAGALTVTVRDTGIGIADTDIDRLFALFEQLDDQNARSGTGLGLAITKRLVESLGGSIQVESELGVGSSFSCVLPMREAARAQARRQSQVERERTGTPLDILVVEDDRINMLVAEKMLSAFGHRVTKAENGERGLELVREHRFDLVFMDYHMPVMDGLEATARIRQKGGEQPVIVGLSASVFGEDRVAMLSAGMDEVITKPITREVFLETIERMTAGRVPQHSLS